MNQDYALGAVVFACDNPTQKLIVRRKENQTYYCKVLTNPHSDERPYAATDLVLLQLHNLDLVT